MAVRRRIPKPVVAAAARAVPRVAKTVSRAAKGAMPRVGSAKVNPRAAKARAAQAKKADAAERRRKVMAHVSKKRGDTVPGGRYITPKQRIANQKQKIKDLKFEAQLRRYEDYTSHSASEGRWVSDALLKRQGEYKEGVKKDTKEISQAIARLRELEKKYGSRK